MNPTVTKQETIIRTSRGLSVAGTRLTLYTIMEHLENEWPPRLIQDWFNLTDEQMEGVLAYIETNREDVEAEYRQVLEEAAETEQYWREYNREHLEKVRAMPPKPGQEEIKKKLEARRKRWQTSQ